MRTAILLLLIVALSACKKEREHIKPETGDITESVYASGKIKADNQYNVYASVNGILQEILVKAGDSVTTGTPLFRIDNVTSELNAQNALLALELSEENSKKGSDKLREAELAVSIANEKYKLDSALYLKQKQLWQQNVGTELDLDQRKLNFENSTAAYKTAVSKLNQLKLILDKERKNAGLNYSISQKMAGDYTVKSSITGKVYDVLREKGELITPQMQLAVIGSADKFVIEMEVDENDIARIKKGQEVMITMDSYKGKVFIAHVTEIYPIMNERSHTFTVKAVFTESPEVLYPNLSLEANVVISTKANTLIIPREYLAEGNYVYLSNDEKVKVKTGLKDYQKVEILEGINSSQFIYKPQ